MKALIWAALALAVPGSAAAEPRYDRKLEEAVMAIVAAKMGDIRGGFALDARPVMVIVQNDAVMATTDIGATTLAPPEGMARATERRPAPATF